MSGKSTIWTELDFERDGKQVGTLNLPYSVTRSAYGVICKRHFGRVERGDCVARLATDV